MDGPRRPRPAGRCSESTYIAQVQGVVATPRSTGVWMGRPAGWATAATGRPPMRSPGRPPVRREIERLFWTKIAEGLPSEDAALACGVSAPVGSRWFRHGGGMSPLSLVPPSGRYLSFAEREEIALLHAQQAGVRQIA